MVPDPAFHDFESGPDCRGFHAHGVGAADLDLCHSASAGIGIDLRGYDGIRSELHAFYQVEFFRYRPVKVEVKLTRQVSHGRHPSKGAAPGGRTKTTPGGRQAGCLPSA